MSMSVVESSGEKIASVLASSIKKIGGKGICVLLSKSSETYKPLLRKAGVNVDNILFIDTVSDSDDKNVINMAGGGLTALALTLREALSGFPEARFVIFESFSSLTLNHSIDSVSQFARFMFSRLNELDVEGIVIVGKAASDAKLVGVLKQFAQGYN